MGELYTPERAWTYTLEGIMDLVKSRVQSNFETSNWYRKEIEEKGQILVYKDLIENHTLTVLNWYLNKVIHGQEKVLTKTSYIINSNNNPNIWFLSADEIENIIVPRIIRSMTKINVYVNETEQKKFNEKYCIQNLEDLQGINTQSIIGLMKYYGLLININSKGEMVSQYEYIPKWLSNQKEYEYEDIFRENVTGIHYSSSELAKIFEEQKEILKELPDLESDDYNNDYIQQYSLDINAVKEALDNAKTHDMFHSKWLNDLTDRTKKLEDKISFHDNLISECGEKILELFKKVENSEDTCICKKLQEFSINNNPDEIQKRCFEKNNDYKEEVLKSEFERLEYISQKKFEKKLRDTYSCNYEKVSYEVYNIFQSKFPEEAKQLRIEYREPENKDTVSVWTQDIFVYIPNIVECLQIIRESKYVEFIQISTKHVLIKYIDDISVKNIRQTYNSLTEVILSTACINDIVPVSCILK